MSQKLLAFILAWALLPVLLFSQTSGKIAGVVSDSETGEALVGVNVYLEGTSLGAATDEDGYYVILGVSVGTYNIVAEYVGYNKFTVEGLRVSPGVTVNQDFAMASTALQMGNVVVVAQRDLVKKNVTSSVSIMEASDIQQLPVRGLTNIVALSPSVVVTNGDVHIRGSRGDEVGYYVDGADASSATSNRRATTVINEAIEEVGVETGAYDAQFGGANGGIIRAELRSGGSKWQGSLDYRSDAWGSDGGSNFLGATSTGLANTIVTFGGPVLADNVRLFVAFENFFQRDNNPRFYEPFSYTGLSAPTLGFLNSGPIDTVDLVWDGTISNHNSFNRYTTNSTLLLDFTNIKFKFSGSYNWSENEFADGAILGLLNERGASLFSENLLLSGKMTWVISPKSFLDVRANYFYNSTHREDDIFGEDYAKWYDPTQPQNAAFNWYLDRPRSYDLFSFNFQQNGNPRYTNYVKTRQEYIGGALDYTAQIGKVHEVKAGMEFKSYTVRNYAVNVATWENFDPAEGVYTVPEDFARAARVNNYGYDEYGNDLDDGLNGAKKPLFGTFYAQDKLEYNDLILKIGLRVDYFDGDDRALTNDTEPYLESSELVDSSFVDVDPYVKLSPRIAMSFPASEKTVFYTGYGQFVQMTQLANIYAGSYAESRLLRGGFAFLNPFGRNLKPTETTNYEIGLRQQIGENMAIDVNAFYRNIKGQIEPIRVVTTGTVESYNVFANGTFVTTKGVEFKFTLRRTERLQLQVNYAYNDAKGTGAVENSAVASLEQGTDAPTVITPLNFNNLHKGSVIFDYRFAKNDGGPVFNQSGANVIFNFNSGHPFTLAEGAYGQTSFARSAVDFETDTRAREPSEPLGSSTTPMNFNFDLRLDKSFDLVNTLSLNIYLEVLNLFDTKNVLNVYSRTGLAEDDGFINNFDAKELESAITSYGPEFRDFYNDVNIANGETFREIGELWGIPRQVRLGLKLSF